MSEPSESMNHLILAALDTILGVASVSNNATMVVTRDGETGDLVAHYPHPEEPFRVWFSVEPDAVTRVLPFLAETVATNYAGLPFRLLIEDTGDGEGLGPKGMLVLCYESDVSLTDKRLPGRVTALARELRRYNVSAA